MTGKQKIILNFYAHAVSIACFLSIHFSAVCSFEQDSLLKDGRIVKTLIIPITKDGNREKLIIEVQEMSSNKFVRVVELECKEKKCFDNNKRLINSWDESFIYFYSQDGKVKTTLPLTKDNSKKETSYSQTSTVNHLQNIWDTFQNSIKLQNPPINQAPQRREFTETIIIDNNTKLNCIGKQINGKREGLRKCFYCSGKLASESIWKNGKLNGEQKVYYDTGELQIKAFYKDGLKDGIARSYYKNGELGIKDTYVNDEKINRRVFNELGKLEFEQDY